MPPAIVSCCNRLVRLASMRSSEVSIRLVILRFMPLDSKRRNTTPHETCNGLDKFVMNI